MTGILLIIGGTALVLIGALVLATTLLVRRGRANHSPNHIPAHSPNHSSDRAANHSSDRSPQRSADRDELLRRARKASGKINRENERTRRGSLRGGGLGADSTPMD